MWNKLVTWLVTSLSLIGCGQAVDAKNTESEIGVKETVDNHPFYNTGQLPNITLSPKMTELEKRVKTNLEHGFSPEAFNGLEDPDAALIKIGGSGKQPKWVMNGQRRVAHLVIRHLESVNDPKNHPANFCEAGQIYSGYVAARPFTRQEFHSTSVQITTVMPYGLFVCDTGSELMYKLASAQSGIFQQ